MDKANDAPGSQNEDPLQLSPKGRALMKRAQNHQLGREFLVQGHPESVAVIHGVSPFVVQEVRDYLGRAPKDLG